MEDQPPLHTNYPERIAAARGGTASVILVTDSGESIPCRDLAQADLVGRLWELWQAGQPVSPGMRLLGADAKPPNRRGLGGENQAGGGEQVAT